MLPPPPPRLVLVRPGKDEYVSRKVRPGRNGATESLMMKRRGRADCLQACQPASLEVRTCSITNHDSPMVRQKGCTHCDEIFTPIHFSRRGHGRVAGCMKGVMKIASMR